MSPDPITSPSDTTFKPCVGDGFVCAVATLQNPAAMVKTEMEWI